ncbi:TDT family transporter [Enterococcus sp. AZ109]|uniref:TDT family transporter n=1 Tax=Enterococcus sp. AZ109 TaxID=2774634 RepID=UPI003F23046F
MKRLIQAADKLPVGLIATTVGLCTLSNAYGAIDFAGVRHLTMLFGLVIWFLALSKIIFHFPIFSQEYLQLVPCSLYATFFMLTAILSSYIYAFIPILGTLLWYISVILHVGHILFFTYRNVIKNLDKTMFIPSWFVTYVGILVPVVVGSKIGHPLVIQGLLIYGFIATFLLFPLMIVRIYRLNLTQDTELMQVIFLAPPSLCLVSYLNVSSSPNPLVANFLYLVILITFIYIVAKMPYFLRRPFNPSFASLTFPLAICLVATLTMGRFLVNTEHLISGNVLTQLFGIMMYCITLVIGYVAYNFLHIFAKKVVDTAKESSETEQLKSSSN